MEKFFMAGIGGFAAWCITILLNVAINALSPFYVPLWSTSIVALLFVTYWSIGSFGECRIERAIRSRRKVVCFAEDPNFPLGDARRKLSRQFYSLREAKRWMREHEARGVINFSLRDVREDDDEVDGMLLQPAPYRRTRVKLAIGYMLVVLLVAAAIPLFVEGVALPDKAPHVQQQVYRRFRFYASMILTWVFLAHAELREVLAESSDRLR
jgi:hypothetical protein